LCVPLDQGHDADIVFLDLATTFDKVPHKRLLEKNQRNMASMGMF